MTATATASQKTRKLLIADDDPGILRFLAGRLTKMGFEVQTANNGLQAIIMASKNQPDALILDINMPELDGLSVCLHVLQPGKKPVDVIVMTASSYADTIERCEGFGVFHVRKGPALWEDLRSALLEIFPRMEAGAVADEEKPLTRLGWRRPRVLVVDGDPEIGKFIASRLDKHGVDTLLAHDSLQAYRIARKEEPSVIVSDYLLPNGDVHYLLWRLRSAPETDRTPVLVMTEKPLDLATQATLQREVSGRPGATLILQKSLETDELFTAIQKYCAFLADPVEQAPLALK
jgi:CheY-like chemotaxis protein